MSVEKYLKPEVVRQISRLDLRAQFVVRGFLQGLHASPFHGFSVEFSEHRKYTSGDDPKDIDWLVYAKTDKYYIKKLKQTFKKFDPILSQPELRSPIPFEALPIPS